ncbi:MAG: helix-turn-helix transcriptional regulator [Acidimicrobiia bacterium]
MADAISIEPLLTVQELAERWQTSPQAIHMARYRGKGPKATKPGGKLLFRLQDVLDYEAQCAADPRPAA